VNHSDVAPDMMVMAKGLTAGYAPLGALGVREDLARHFDTNRLWAGLTGYAHPISCAAALATLEVLEGEGLIERSKQMGELLDGRLKRMAEKFPMVGEGRAKGLYGVIEFVGESGGKSYLVPEGASGASALPLNGVTRGLREEGLHMAVKGPRAFVAPPLTISEADLNEGLDRLERVLEREL
jgi:taurine--2-oxoglutarate transaminase